MIQFQSLSGSNCIVIKSVHHSSNKKNGLFCVYPGLGLKSMDLDV